MTLYEVIWKNLSQPLAKNSWYMRLEATPSNNAQWRPCSSTSMINDTLINDSSDTVSVFVTVEAHSSLNRFGRHAVNMRATKRHYQPL